MAERTPAADSEKVEEIAQDKTRKIDAILSAEAPVDTESGRERRVRRNIITVPEQNNVEIEKDGKKYRRDENGRWRRVLH